MAIGDNTNSNLFGTNYNPEDEEEKKARLAAQNARIGAGNVPASAFGQAPAVAPFSLEAAGQVNPMMEPQSLAGAPGSPQANFAARMATGEALSSQEIQDAGVLATSMGTTFDPSTGYSREAFLEAERAKKNSIPKGVEVPMTGMRPVNPQTGEFLSQSVIAAGEEAGLTFPSQVSLPKPQAPQAPIAPMGQDETRAALGGMTLNEYLNSPVGTPGVSGLQTDPQGRMVPNIGQFQAQPEVAQPPVDSAVPNAIAQPPAGALSSFEKDSLARQQRIGGTGSFEGDSDARDARLRAEERQPGETQTQRDTRVAQSRTQGSSAGGQLSQADLRDLAQGSSRDATDGEKARALEIQQRAGLGEFKPDMTPSEQEALQVESADKESFNTSISNSTSPEGVVDYNQALNKYVKGGGSSKGYLEFLRKGQELEQKAKDAGKKPEITVVEIGGFRALLQDGRYMTGTTVGGEELSTSAIRTLQGRIELLGDAEEDYFSGDSERMKRAERTITALDIKNDFGGQLSAKDYFEPNSDDTIRSFATESEANASGVKGEVVIGGRKAIIN
jgi:hypothetical protein